MRPRNRRLVRLSMAARVFVLIALIAPVVRSEVPSAAVALVAIGLIWNTAQITDFLPRSPVGLSFTVEAALIGVVCGVAMHSSLAVLGALAVPAFTAGLYRGLTGVALALSAQLAALLVAGALSPGGLLHSEMMFTALTWSMTGLGLGLIATFLHSSLETPADPLAPYHYAQTLIRQLIDLSGGLSSGLDPTSLGGAILSAVQDELPTTALVMHIPRGDTLAPLLTKATGQTADLERTEDIAVEAWAVGHPVVDGAIFAFPLRTDAGTTAVVAGVISDRIDLSRLGIEDRIRRLHARLEASAVHLDTALLFAAFRDAATAEERRRLAREMHDGVAQDIASLGYVVDALSATASSPAQAQQIEVLRDRITAIVSEIRRSVVTLRTSVGASESLGTAIGSIARNLSEVSGMPIHVTLDERTGRLRPEVEAELFRIAQEAMNNAVKHAQATSIAVHCLVHPPEAQITVTDDGRGLQAGRSNSHGLEIMRERALLINADLSITDLADGGLSVSVHIPANRGVSGTSAGASHARVTA